MVRANHYYRTNRTGKIYIEVKGSIIKSNSNEFLGYIIEINDITDKKRQELQLKELHQNLEFALSEGRVSAWKYDIQKRQYTTILGNTVVGEGSSFDDCEKIMHSDDRQMIRKIFEELISGERQKSEALVRFFDSEYGDYRYYESEMSSRTNEKGEIKNIIGTQRDVTEKCLKEIELNNARKSLDMAMDSSNVMAWDYDLLTQQYRVLYGNRLIERHSGVGNYHQNIHPDDSDRFVRAMTDLINNKSDQKSIDVRIKDTKTGKYSSFEQSVSSIKNRDGKVVGLIGSLYDITERNEQIAKLEEQNHKNELIYDVCGIVPWNYNPHTHGLISYSDNAIFPNTEVNVKESLNPILQLVHPDDRAAVTAFIANMDRMESDVVHLEMRMLSSDRIKYNHLISDGIAIKDKEGTIIKYSGIDRDVNKWVEINERLEEQNITNSTILNNINSLLIYSDKAGEIKWSNIDTYSDLLFKLGISDFTKEKICTLTQEGGGQICERMGTDSLLREVIRQKTIIAKEVTYADVSVHISGIPVTNSANNIIGVLCKIDDVTEDKKIENELISTRNNALKANQILNEFFDKIPCALYIKDYDDDLKFVMANKIFQEDLCSGVGDIIGKTSYDFLDKKIADQHTQSDRHIATSEQMHIYDDEVITPKGSRYWHIMKSSMKITNEHRYVIGIGMDITAIKETKNKLIKAKDKVTQTNLLLNEIINRIPVPMFVLDVDNKLRYTRANIHFAKIVNKTLDELIGQNDYELFTKEIADRHHIQCQKLIHEQETVTYDHVVAYNGQQKHLSITRSIVRTKNGNSLIIGILSDVTKLRELNTELERAKTKAEESNQLKSAFLANMSHEIRTPLNAIVGFSELMQSCDDPAEKEEYMKIINTNNELLLRLIGDILDLSKIESNMVDLKLETFDISPLFEETYTTLKPRCEKSEVKLFSHNPYSRCIVTLDKNRLLQIWTNFINNAVKYTQEGSITIGYDHTENGIRLFVKDTGIGISAEKQSRLFQRFEKLDNFAQGTGLGLSICKAIVEKMGGRIGAESEVGQGSTFWAWLPCEAEIEYFNNKQSTDSSKANDSNTHSTSKQIKNILVAEDNDSNYMLVNAILKEHHLTRAHNGEEAVEHAKLYKYDAILMDMKMPIMGGLEATRKIRMFDKETTIIAVTANAFDSDKEEAVKAGCNSFVTKPLSRKSLEDAIFDEVGCNSLYINTLYR